MTSQAKEPLAERVARAAKEALAADGTVSAIDILYGLGWLHLSTFKRWQQGQIAWLEAGLDIKPPRLLEAMELFRAWATSAGLESSEIDYVSKTPSRTPLRFTASGDETAERLYRARWMSPELTQKKRASLEAKANRPPELVVIQPLHSEWKCQRCGGTGDLLIMENDEPSCLDCAGLGSLVFLPAGNATLSRRAKAKSSPHAVVVRFSKSRKRYERQGLLVQPQALREAEQEL